MKGRSTSRRHSLPTVLVDGTLVDDVCQYDRVSSISDIVGVDVIDC